MKIILLFIVALMFSSSPCLADWFTDYVEYRCIPHLGLIQIIDGTVRGEKYCNYLADKSNITKLATANIFSCDDDVSHTYKRTEALDGHTVSTIIQTFPPVGHGYGGAVPRRYIKIIFDNKTKIDCSFGDAPWENELVVKSINIYPADGIIHIDATANTQDLHPDKKTCEDAWQATTFLNNPTVVTDEILLNATKYCVY